MNSYIQQGIEIKRLLFFESMFSLFFLNDSKWKNYHLQSNDLFNYNKKLDYIIINIC